MPQAEYRRIQLTGGSTYVVSLPKKWVDRNHLGRKDLVAIHEETDGSLLVVPHSEGESRRRRVQVDLPAGVTGEDVVRRLVGAYLAGADEITVRSDGPFDPAARQALRETKRDLVGLEILDEGRNSITLQDLVGTSEMDVRKAVTRMHRIAHIMFQDAMSTLKSRDDGLAKEVSDRDDEVDRLEWLVSKQLHALLDQPRLAAKLQIRPAEALNQFLVARSLERIGDHASKICRNVRLLEEDVPDNVLGSLQKQGSVVQDLWDEAFSSLKRNDFEQASKAVDAGKKGAGWRARFSNLLGDLNPELVSSLTLIADSIDRTRGYAIDIAEIAMNNTFQGRDV